MQKQILRAILLLMCICNYKCTSNTLLPIPSNGTVAYYISIGDSIYSHKKGFESFSKSLVYYDSAMALADKSDNLTDKGEAHLSVGKAYDAWGQQNDKTVYYYGTAASFFKQAGNKKLHYYARLLTCHAYQKNNDTPACISNSRSLFLQVMADSIADIKWKYPAKLASAVSMFGYFLLADSMLRAIPDTRLIRNEMLNYKEQYVLARVNLQLGGFSKTSNVDWLDSLTLVLAEASNISDSTYLTGLIAQGYKKAGNQKKAYDFLEIENELMKRLNPQKSVNTLRAQLLQTEINIGEREKKLLQHTDSLKTRIIIGASAIVAFMGGLLLSIIKSRKKIAVQKSQLEKTNRLLDEKAEQNMMLVKEIHHRVKNNLYLIYSLLELQARKTQSPETLEHLTTARQRIESIALMHEKLYVTENANVDLKNYIEEMVAHFTQNNFAGRQILTQLKIAAVMVPASICFPLALILNEWLTNSIKYAKPEDENLEITVAANIEYHLLHLTYADNGICCRDAENQPGLGTKIINLLTKQLNAVLVKNKNDKAYHYQLIIPTK